MSAKTATKKPAEVKKEFNLERACVMWIYKSKKSESKYLSGRVEGKDIKLKGFFNREKQNPKEPDIKLYTVDGNNKTSKEVYLSLWVNASDNGKKYASGKLGDKRVVGFFNSRASVDGVIPYLNVYFSDDTKEEEKVKEAKEPEFEEIAPDNDLPF